MPVFSGWLRVVARTELSDCRRGHRRFLELLRRHRWNALTEDAISDEEEQLRDVLDAALTQLDPDDRALLEAKYFSGVQVRDIAEKLSLSSKAVESRLTRARATLRRQLLAALRPK